MPTLDRSIFPAVLPLVPNREPFTPALLCAANGAPLTLETIKCRIRARFTVPRNPIPPTDPGDPTGSARPNGHRTTGPAVPAETPEPSLPLNGPEPSEPASTAQMTSRRRLPRTSPSTDLVYPPRSLKPWPNAVSRPRSRSRSQRYPRHSTGVTSVDVPRLVPARRSPSVFPWSHECGEHARIHPVR